MAARGMISRAVLHCGRVNYVLKHNRCTSSHSQVGVSKKHTRALVPYTPHKFVNHFETARDARIFVLNLDETGRFLIHRELQRIQEKETQDRYEEEVVSGDLTVTGPQLWRAFYFNCIPFIGFGLLDNVIMIVAGEYIDATVGAVLGISTMAAAALGNLISDLAGVGTAGYVEAIASRLGVHPPDITPEQSELWQCRTSVAFGRGFGIALGCLLGMFPLLFYNHEADDKTPIEDPEEVAAKSCDQCQSILKDNSECEICKGTLGRQSQTNNSHGQTGAKAKS